MKDYFVTITVKNNVLLHAMKQSGFNTAAELSRVSGVCQGTIGQYLNLKTVPLGEKGFNDAVLKISKTLRMLPEDLFPEQHLEKAFNKNKTSVEIDVNGVKNILEQKNPERLIELKETKDQINLVLTTLPDRDRAVIEHRFGLNRETEKTVRQCGIIFNVSAERLRQIEAKALRRLRHPSRSDSLRDNVI